MNDDTCLRTRRKQQKEARRRDILEAGFQVFAAQGFTATRLDEVAERAGVGKGTIYLYFESKEALFEEVVRENVFPGRDEAEHRVSEFKGCAADLLASHLHYVYSRMDNEKMPALVALVMGESHRFPHVSEFFFREVISRTQENMRRIVERGIASGEFRRTDALRFTQLLVAPVLIGAVWKLQYQAVAPLDMEAYARAHIDLVLNGLRT